MSNRFECPVTWCEVFHLPNGPNSWGFTSSSLVYPPKEHRVAIKKQFCSVHAILSFFVLKLCSSYFGRIKSSASGVVPWRVVRCHTGRFCCDLRNAPLQHPLDLGSPHCLVARAGGWEGTCSRDLIEAPKLIYTPWIFCWKCWKREDCFGRCISWDIWQFQVYKSNKDWKRYRKSE